MDLHELFMAMRWAVLALTAAALALMWLRRAAVRQGVDPETLPDLPAPGRKD